MTTTIAVTYTGSDEPFVDRIYHSGLTFTNGQTRDVPAALAQRFLRHSDVFSEADSKPAKTQERKAGTDDAKTDDTAQQLEQAAEADKKRQEQENARFDLLQQVEVMDKAALRDFAKVNYRQDIHPNTGVEKARDMVRGFIDQFGAP